MRAERDADDLGRNAGVGPGDEIAHRLEVTLAEHDGVDMLVLFGSLARGDEGTDSDVDLIVDGPVTKDVAARTLLRGRLIEELGRSVELMSIDEARRAPEVILGAVRDGRVIKDLTGRWPALLRDRERIEAQAHAEHRTYPARKAAALARLIEAKRI